MHKVIINLCYWAQKQKDVTYNINNKKRPEAKLHLSRYKLILDCYNFRLINVISMVTVKEISVEYTQ